MQRSRVQQGAKPPSQRQLRVGELVRHAMSDILMRGEVHDPELESANVTVPEVQMSPDLRHATIYVMPLGGGDAQKAVAALDRNGRYLRGAVAKRVDLRLAPELHFRVDNRFDTGARIDALLRSPEVRRDLEPRNGDQDD
jgi:ribosome-binding factor A